MRRDLAVPVDRPAEAAHLPADRGDVPVGDLARVAALLDRRVLGRQAEGVVAHRAQHGVAVPAAEVGDDVPERVVQDVAHVHPVRRRVREHLEHVEGAVVRPRRPAPGCRPRTRARPPRPPAISARSPAGRMRRGRLRPSSIWSPETKKPLDGEAVGKLRGVGRVGFLGQVISRAHGSQCNHALRMQPTIETTLLELLPDTAASPTASCRSAGCARRSSSSGSGRRSSSTTRRPCAHRRGRTAPPRRTRSSSTGRRRFRRSRCSRLLAEEGLGADVSTSGELAFALAAGIAGEQIVVHGNNKEDELLAVAGRGRARSSCSTRSRRSRGRGRPALPASWCA